MKVKKGGVVLAIPPTDLKIYKQAGWTLVQEPTREQIKKHNESAKQKRLAKQLEKGGS